MKKPSFGPPKVRQPAPEAQWRVTADLTNGNKPGYDQEHPSEKLARADADWLHSSPGFMNAEIHGPEFDGTKTEVSPEDERIGAWLAAALEDRKVSPCMKFDINRWLDSKEWK